MTDSSYANRRALATFIFMLFISTMQQKHQIQRINSEMIEHKSIEELAANESKEKCTNEQQDFSNAMFFGGILAEYIKKANRANTTKINSKQSIVKENKNSCSRVDEMHGTTISQQKQSISSSSNSGDPSLGSTTTSFVEQDVLTAAPTELPPAETTKQSSQQQQRIVVDEAQHPHQKRNYASKECGAKVLYANEEAENRGAILNDPERDDYMRNPCERAQNKFLIIELCETIQPTSLDIANLELFSSNPKEFRLSGSERYPTQEWALIGEFEAPDNREIHEYTFNVQPEHAAYAKFIKLELLSHHGNEHFCTLSTFRLYGTSMVDEYEAEASSLSEEQEKQRIASAKRAEKTRLEFLDRVLRRQTAAFCPLPSSAPLTCRRKSEASQNGQPQKQQQPKIGEQQRQENTETNNNGNGATNGVKQLLIQKSIVANKVVDKANLRPLPGTSTNNKESVFMKLKSMAEKLQKLETKISALERENAVKQSDPSMATMMQMLRDFGDKFGKIEKEMADLKEENRELKNENNKLREDIAELRDDLVEKGQELDEKCSFCMYN